jgi:hypothetical protein
MKKKLIQNLAVLCMVSLAVVMLALPVMATTHDVSTGSKPGAFTRLQLHTIRGTVNFAGATYASNDVVRIVKVPAGYMVLGVMTDVETASASDTTIDVGTATSATAFSSNVSVTNAAETVSATGEAYFGTAGWVQLTLDDAITNGVVDVEVIMAGPLTDSK